MARKDRSLRARTQPCLRARAGAMYAPERGGPAAGVARAGGRPEAKFRYHGWQARTRSTRVTAEQVETAGSGITQHDEAGKDPAAPGGPGTCSR